ncbi:MAG: YaiO family outer membrane beta-barrel protein [Fidelibacterota bacterium]|nr:MAG: YaiO family outer membrane beta-barrel protein [Candidatus Neomarinimicrobiota bacterium]
MTSLVLMILPIFYGQGGSVADSAAGAAAVQESQHYLSGDSRSYDEKLDLARQLAHSNRRQEAIELYTIFLTEYPDDPDLLLGRGLVYAWEGQYAEGEADLLAVTRHVPTYADAWMALGNLYLWWERSLQSVEACSRWAELQPDNAAPYIARAKAYRSARQFAQARKDLIIAIKLGGDREEISGLLRQLDRIPTALPWEPILLLDVQTFSTDRPDWSTTTALVKREVSLGSIAVGFIQTRRFDQEDRAFLLDSYMNLWRRGYANIRLQFAPWRRVLPGSDTIIEIFQGVGKGWELSGSYRRMAFPETLVYILGSSLAWYLGSWYLRSQTLFVPIDEGIDRFTMATARRYIVTVDNFLEIGAGLGREVVTGLIGPEYAETYVLIVRGQTFINSRWGFTLSGNLQQTPDYRQRGLSVGVIARL